MARGSWAASTTSHVLAAQHCKVYVHELHQPLAAHRQPAAWPSHQYAMELHLAEAAKRSPWRTHTRSEADLVVAVANFSLFCVAGKTFMRRTNWYEMLSDRTLWPHGAANASWHDGAILVMLQASMCGVPWADTRGSFKPRNIVTLAEEMRRPYPPSVQVTPFVVASPAWLVGGAAAGVVAGDAERAGAGSTGGATEQPPPIVPWARRKLLFFACHVPKLFIKPTRYLIWKQLRRDPRVTATSWSVLCTIGSYRTCLLSDLELRRRALALEGEAKLERNLYNGHASGLVSFIGTHCHALGCSNESSCDTSLLRTHSDSAALRSFRQRCKPYLELVNFTSELPDMEADATSSRRFIAAQGHTDGRSHMAAHGQQDDAYLGRAMAHRFCLVAPGDFWSTKKIAETVAIGGAGGCIPIIVVPPPHTKRLSHDRARRARLNASIDESLGLGQRLSRFLPYTSWLDWCVIHPLSASLMAQVMALDEDPIYRSHPSEQVLDRLPRLRDDRPPAPRPCSRPARGHQRGRGAWQATSPTRCPGRIRMPLAWHVR